MNKIAEVTTKLQEAGFHIQLDPTSTCDAKEGFSVKGKISLKGMCEEDFYVDFSLSSKSWMVSWEKFYDNVDWSTFDKDIQALLPDGVTSALALLPDGVTNSHDGGFIQVEKDPLEKLIQNFMQLLRPYKETLVIKLKQQTFRDKTLMSKLDVAFDCEGYGSKDYSYLNVKGNYYFNGYMEIAEYNAVRARVIEALGNAFIKVDACE